MRGWLYTVRLWLATKDHPVAPRVRLIRLNNTAGETAWICKTELDIGDMDCFGKCLLW